MVVASLAAGLIASAFVPAQANPVDRIGEKLADVTLTDTAGKPVDLLSLHTDDVLVVAYTGVGCPIAMRYGPRLEELSKDFAKKGVRFVGINANPQDSLESIAAEAKELGMTFPVLKDSDQKLTEQLDAKTTTVVFVVDKQHVIRYRGMVDDQYAVGVQRDKPKYKYLEKALKSVLKDQDPVYARTAAPGCRITLTNRVADNNTASEPEGPTYAEHIAPILQARCQQCHRPEQIGPFPLTSYEETLGWSAMIHTVVSLNRMPPWNADHEFDGMFVNQRSLPKEEKKLILDWIENGMPQGDPAKTPPNPEWPDKWRIGDPDKTYTMQESFAVPKEGVVEYQYFPVPSRLRTDRWIKAVEARPGAADVVHHVLAFVHEKGAQFDRGRIGLDDGYLCATVPGDTPSIYPAGYAKRLPANSNLILQMHYTPIGKVRRDRSSIGVIFAEEPPKYEVLTRGIYNRNFTIPAGDPNYEIKAKHRFDQDIKLLALYPHMHYRGKDWAFVAHLPDGTDHKLLSVSQYDFNWQESYILKEPMDLPAGTEIECIAHYDNSADNFANPDPTVDVKFGEQTWEEMMIGYIDYVIADARIDENTQASAR